MISRRAILKRLLASGAVAAVPVSQGFVEAVLAQPAERAIAVLSAEQARFLGTVADAVIPATDTPSATEVGVVQFIDFMLERWYAEAEVEAFLAGLEEAARTGAGQTPADRITDLDAESFEPEREPEPRHAFYRLAKELILIGYYTSAEGARQNLNVFGPVGDFSFEATGAPGAAIAY